ncbi:MAG: signal peptide peptidase SppA [Nodosilinea sp.]
MGQFLKYTLASFVGSLLLLVLLVFFLAIGAVGLAGLLIASLGGAGAKTGLDKNTILVYDLSAAIADSPSPLTTGTQLLQGTSEARLSLRRAVMALEQAAQDDHIAGLYLKGGNGDIGAGLADQVDLRQAIATFKASGKPILAYNADWNEQQYNLAALAHTLYLNPFGALEMNGLYAQTMYQAEALAKVGVGVQVTRVGKYKSAVEPFLRNSMSPEERDQARKLLEDVWQTLISNASQARSLAPQQIQAIANSQGFLFGTAARSQKLVDQVAYEDDVITALRQITKEDQNTADVDKGFRQITLPAYASDLTDELTNRSASDQLALVYAEGAIVDGDRDGSWGQTRVIPGNTLASQLRQLRQDRSVKALVLRIDSPGGSATAAEVIQREVQLFRKAGKPVVVSMGNVAASGGYWIASSANLIMAQPTTITGSIGVFSLFLNLKNLGDKVGIAWDGVKTADLADISSSTRPKTAAELAILQKNVDVIYDAFLERVEAGRHLPRPRVAELAQGRVWSGKTAQRLGLVDELGGINQAIAKAAQLAKLGDRWQLREYPQDNDWQGFLSLFSHTRGAQVVADPLTTQINHWVADFRLIKTLNDPKGIYLLMPYTWRIN